MSRNIVISIISYVIVAILIPVLYGTSKKNVKKMGECLLPFPKKNLVGMIAVDIAAAVLLAILIFRNFGNMTILLAGCCILSVYIMSKDGFTQKHYGVYENGLIAPNHIIFFDDIIAFPVFELPPEEQEHYAKNTLVIVTESKGKIEIVFPTEEQCSLVVSKLKQMNVITIDID